MSAASDLIRDARRRSRISQRELAIRAGSSQAAISRIERGLEEPTLERIEQILAGLGWRPVISLEPIAEHDADVRRLYEGDRDELDNRIEAGLNWMETARELAGTGNGRAA